MITCGSSKSRKGGTFSLLSTITSCLLIEDHQISFLVLWASQFNRHCCWFNSINSTAGQRKNNTFDFQSSCPFKYPLLFKHNIEIHLYLMKILSNNNAISNPYPLRRIYLAWEESVFVQHPLCVASTCNLVLYLIVIMQIPFKSQRYIL